MGVRPPANRSDEPDVIEFGIAALDARLREHDVDYPVSARTLAEEIGDLPVPYDVTGNTMTLADALREADADRFENERELLNALHPVFEDRREAAGNNIFAQLRALVPF